MNFMSLPNFFYKLTLTDQIYISSQFAALMNSGLVLSECLAALSEETHSRRIGNFLSMLNDAIHRGESLSDVFVDKNGWHPLAAALIGIGESSGTLAVSFADVAAELSRMSETKKKIIGAMVYPICIALFASALVFGIVNFIFPKIIPVIGSLKGNLPFSTKALIFFVQFTKSYFIWIIASIFFSCAVLFFSVKKSVRLKIFLEKCALITPVWGGFLKSKSIIQIFKSIGILIAAENNLVETLDVVISITPNLVYRQVLVLAKEKIAQGGRLSEALAVSMNEFGRFGPLRCSLLPKTLVSVLAVGERTGTLFAVCERIASLQSKKLDVDIAIFSKMIEPAIMIVLGFVVGFVAISIITPIYEITSSIRR